PPCGGREVVLRGQLAEFQIQSNKHLSEIHSRPFWEHSQSQRCVTACVAAGFDSTACSSFCSSMRLVYASRSMIGCVGSLPGKISKTGMDLLPNDSSQRVTSGEPSVQSAF